MSLLPALLLMPVAALGTSVWPVPQTLDNFDEPGTWTASASDGVTASAASVSGVQGAAVRLDYDFTRGSGYAVLRRQLPIDLQGNFKLRFKLRGEGASNALELKLVDGSGDNVWWHRYPDLVPPREWTEMTVKRRQIEFAWGPGPDKVLRRAAAVEFVVSAGKGGGKGWIAIDDLTIERLPDPPLTPPPVTITSEQRAAIDGDPGTSAQICAAKPLQLDFGYAREFGGLVIRWGGAGIPDYGISLSGDGQAWRAADLVHTSGDGVDWVRLPESEARYLRLQPMRGCANIADVEVKPLAFGETANAFVTAIAHDRRRGLFPRGFTGEQNYWTLVAGEDGAVSGLMDETGAIESGPGGFSVEPFVRDGERLYSWADVSATQSLREGYLPMPRVGWAADGLTLDITSFAADGTLFGRYTLGNAGADPKTLDLVLAVRPFQVNPPQQFLNIAGGVSPITTIKPDGSALVINSGMKVAPATPPDELTIAALASGLLPGQIERDAATHIDDPAGLASASLVYRVVLAPGQRRRFAVAIGKSAEGLSLEQLDRLEAGTGGEWRQRLGRVELSGPPAAQPVFKTLRSALAQILMSRDGAALRPGTRAYARSWIRDGAMMSDALLRMGEVRAASDFLNWYAQFQYADGKVPCCVDLRGPDPVPENDSDGEFIHLVAQLQRYDPDIERSRRLWPRVRSAAGHIAALRRQTMTPSNRAPGTAQFYGLLPPSISHEGYSAKPMHSYWDDFWALAGLKDAAWLAAEVEPGEAEALRREGAMFEKQIEASITEAIAVHDIGFIPGSADLGDFDATSTTIALSVAGEQNHLPPQALKATFDRYWNQASKRTDKKAEWEDYTPYEWRNVGAFVRLGWRDRADALAAMLMKDRRPAPWNQWAEVVGKDPRKPRFIGDMPHGWVASDFINATLDRLAFVRSSDDAIVLAAGVPRSWIGRSGLSVKNLRLPGGTLSYSLVRSGRLIRLFYSFDGRLPRGGLVLKAPGLTAETRLPGTSGRMNFQVGRPPKPAGTNHDRSASAPSGEANL